MSLVELDAPPIEEVQPTPPPAVNIPLTDAQKLSLKTMQVERITLEKNIADIQTQIARLDAMFHQELINISTANNIDREKFSLNSKTFAIQPVPLQPPQPAGQPR